MKKETNILLLFLLYLMSPVVIVAQPGKKAGALSVIISGTITEWTHNDDFLYDGFYLQSEGGSYLVKFPPHMAKAVYDCGKTVKVHGMLKRSPQGGEEIHISSVEGNGMTAIHIPPQRPTKVPIEDFVSGKGTVKSLQLNKKGDVSGYFLDENIILRVPPHIARRLTQLVQENTSLEYAGIVKTLKAGEMSKDDYKIIRCQTITINGTQYIIK